MTKKEFMAIGDKPKVKVKWGGKLYTLVRTNKATESCFLQPKVQKTRPYAVGYESVEII